MSEISISDQMAKILSEESQRIRDMAKDAIQEVAKDTATELKETSPKRTGKYARSWGVVWRNGAYIVRNKEYRLTHLLENGHAKVSGGRVAAIPHIKPAEEKAEKELMAKLRREL